ncbi:hypothetical protein [Marivirga sp.]|uniref:hypothetical protein n=1 Tax=Marivirga sp. TaxID=2018662 RepID=UPI003DA775EF
MMNKKYLFLILVILFDISLFISNNYLITDSIFYEHYQSQISEENILDILTFKDKWEGLNYLILPFIILVKIGLLGFWLLSASILFNIKLGFSKVIECLIIAEFVFIFPPLIKMVWFFLFQNDYTLLDVHFFEPLSIFSMFNPAYLDTWIIYPLKTLNLFEFFYILLLSYVIAKKSSLDFDASLKFNFAGYGSALVVWILFVTFLSINLGA